MTSSLFRSAKPLFLSVLLPILASIAQAAPIIGAHVVVATDGEVIATYRGNSAAYSNDLYLSAPANGIGIIFNNHASPVGSSKSLGFFTAGTELIFKLHVNNTGYDYYTGAASRNPDGQFHARVDGTWSATETLVEFEDLFNGPFHFNDLSFSFTNVAATTSVPDAASTLGLLAGALAGLAWVRRARR